MSRLSFHCVHVYSHGFRMSAQFETTNTVTALCGPSGSGKTTILRLIAGLLRPQSGRIHLGERILVDVENGIYVPPEHRGIGMVFQDLCLFPHMTVRRNLEYGLRRVRPPEGDRNEVIDLLEIGDLLGRYPSTLSGGQRQRVALGRALLRSPQLLLLDEPLAALDKPLQLRVLTYLQRVIERYNLPTILVTHDRDQVRAVTQSIISLDDGRVA